MGWWWWEGGGGGGGKEVGMAQSKLKVITNYKSNTLHVVIQIFSTFGFEQTFSELNAL